MSVYLLHQTPSCHTWIRSLIHHSLSHLRERFSVSDAGGQQHGLLDPVVPDTKRVPGDRPAAAVAAEADRPARPPHTHHPQQCPTHLRADVNKGFKTRLCVV